MDFCLITQKSTKKGITEIYPAFKVGRSKDLMVRGKSFYAIWDEAKGIWSTDEDDVRRLIDKELTEYKEKVESTTEDHIIVKTLRDFDSNSWKHYREFLSNMYDTAQSLDDNLTFQDTPVTKKDLVSRRLPYPLKQGTYSAWDEIIGTLYDPEERQKIEWAIGAIMSGDAKTIQKFLVLYGEGGSGKSTILNIIQRLFVGYYTTFEAKELTSSNNSFSTESFKGNPLVAIQHDGDLSKIEDNSKLNAIVSHEEMTMNEKYRPSYSAKVNCFLFMGTNKPVKITDGKSGLIRRLIDVKTSGRKVSTQKYQALMSQIDFELGAIAYHCLEVYRGLGKHYFSGYVPLDMMFKTDIFFNFVEAYYYEFAKEETITLSRAYELYKVYCDESFIEHKMPRYKFRDELKNYFNEFVDRTRVEGTDNPVRSVYKGFQTQKFLSTLESLPIEEKPTSLVLDSEESIFDKVAEEYQAQLASPVDGFPIAKWKNAETRLKDIDTTKLHYVVLAQNHIVIDFDLKDSSGEKSALLNLEAASKWPVTYAEYSKSGKGVHLHYFYDVDPDKLSGLYSEGIEIKRTIVGENGPTSLRRMLSKCNTTPIAHISGGLPLKGEKMIDTKTVASEKGLRDLVLRNINKEFLPGTKPSIDFIYKILDDAYNSGLKYDLTTLRPKVLVFANNSSNQSEYCVKLVAKMKFKSEEIEEPALELSDNSPMVMFDVEVFINVFIICWKFKGKDQKTVRMINPTTNEVGALFKYKLVGFNNRTYDNHILYAAYLGYSNKELYDVSSKIVSNNSQNGYFREAYNISYTDVYDFSSAANKKSLKKWEIELGIHHQELGHPWDQPLPESMWFKAAEYCENDVEATEIVFDHLSGDWAARKVLAQLSGLTVNDTTNQHTTQIVFGSTKKDRASELVYTDLTTTFPGYKFDSGKSTYRGYEVGEGGYVYAEPGMYENVALLDVASMHPASIINLNLLGRYTKRYSDLRAGRVAIKHNDRETLKTLLDGKLIPFIEKADAGEFSLKDLSSGLKTALVSAYGLTYAHHDNAFRDPKNIDNIVAKRGALFMVDLQYAVQEKGFIVAHIKTDSIKIPNATKEIIDFVFAFGKKYGYEFEHEETYRKFCLVNNAVYIAQKQDGTWTATGAEFQHPFVFKSLFTKEEIKFEDLCETKSVTGKSALYLDMNEELKEGEHNYIFVGRVGSFCPVESGTGGGLLMREKEGKYYAATGTSGYRWLEAETVKNLGLSDQIDTSYHESLANDAIEHISEFGNFDKFVSNES